MRSVPARKEEHRTINLREVLLKRGIDCIVIALTKNVRAVGVVREVSFLDSCLCLRFLIDESEREHDICSLSERRLHAFFIGFRNLLHKIPPLLSCVNEIELTISIMGRVSVSIDPIGFCTSVTRIHLYGFLTSCNRVDECHIHEEVVENTQYATPLFSGEPRPFKTINLVLVSTHTLTHHSTVGISAPPYFANT